MTCYCIASSSWLTTPKFITNAAARSFRPLFNTCSKGLHRKSTSSTIASYSQWWYNLERRGISPAPKIDRHWMEADALHGGQHQGKFLNLVEKHS
ncbi:hypothetical protein P3S68_005897 [Capsicum galapagoense]